MSAHELVRLEYHELTVSDGFTAWLDASGAGLAFTNGARLFTIGARGDRLFVRESQYDLATAVTPASRDTLYLATKYQLWRLQNALPDGQRSDDGCDRIYVPQTAWTVGAIHLSDLSVTTTGQPLFVNGLFSCLATTSETLNFKPVWTPPWISTLVPEERCLLTGVALVDDAPRYVTSASTADEREGWRAHPTGGVVVDVAANEVITTGLAQPRSPLVVGDRLWLCNAAASELGFVDRASGAYTAVAGVPGYARGLTRVGDDFVVGTSRLDRADAGARCGVHVVDGTTGAVRHSLDVAGVALEIWDVSALDDTRSPKAIAFTGDDIETIVTIPRFAR